MTAEQLYAAILAVPFRPFALKLADTGPCGFRSRTSPELGASGPATAESLCFCGLQSGCSVE
jgi:hypothetical protein